MINQRNRFLLLLLFTLISCSNKKLITNDNPVFSDTKNGNDKKKIKVRCTPRAKSVEYKRGDLPCIRDSLFINENEQLKIVFKVTNPNSDDLYEHGYQELWHYKNGKIIEKMKLRRDEDAYWSEVPFVRIRKQTYLADLDNDGYKEFAIFPFSSGSAIWGTVRIFSLKDKIEFWGEGRYQFEGDTYVQLDCMDCSKFNSLACQKCK